MKINYFQIYANLQLEGIGYFFIISTLSGSGLMPSTETKWQRNFNSEML